MFAIYYNLWKIYVYNLLQFMKIYVYNLFMFTIYKKQKKHKKQIINISLDPMVYF